MEEDIAISQFQILGVISLIILGFELIALISMSRRYIPTGKFRGIDKFGIYKLKPGIGHCPISGVPLIFPVHSCDPRKNTMK